MENKIDKILTLSDNSKVMILDQGNYNGKAYFFITDLDEFDNITDRFSILEENIVDGEITVKTVKEEKLFKALIEYFKKRFEVVA